MTALALAGVLFSVALEAAGRLAEDYLAEPAFLAAGFADLEILVILVRFDLLDFLAALKALLILLQLHLERL